MAHPDGKTRGQGSASAPWRAFLAGVVIVAAVIAVLVYIVGRPGAPSKPLNIEVGAPKIPEINMPNAPRLPKG